MILVFGSNGQLASSLKETGLATGATFVGSCDADFTRDGSIEATLEKVRPKIIVNASAYTKVDLAETDREACQRVNSDALARIGKWALSNDASVVHFSTDYVFPGTGTSPWSEKDETAPLNWYGATKLEGEERLRQSGCHAVTFRTSWLFSEYGTNFVKTMLRLGAEREHLSVVSDQVGNPTYAMDIARFLDKAMDRIRSREVEGLYHLSNTGPTSWHGFAEYIFERASSSGHPLRIKSVAPISSSQYPTPAKRPSNSTLCGDRTRAAFGATLPHWKDAVDRCLSKMGMTIEGH